MNSDLSESYRILELAPGATLEEVKRSYRELVKVWHPDRFVSDPKLQMKAQEKLKQINLAYERICKGDAEVPRRRSSSTGTSASQAGEKSRPADGSGSASNRDEPRTDAPREPPPPQRQPTPAPTRNWGRRIVKVAATVAIIVVIITVFSTSNRSGRQTTGSSPPHNQPRQSYSAPDPQAVQSRPTARQHLTIAQILELHSEALKRRPDLRISVQEFSRYMQANQTDYDFSEGMTYSPPRIVAQPERVAPHVPSAPVLEQPAAPDKQASPATETVAPPKSAESAEKVAVALADTRSIVSLTPSSHERSFFTVGSTKEEVLTIQGTPTGMSENEFSYGYSTVRFRNGRVDSWHDISKVLKTKMVPSVPMESMGFFTIGSTKDEVLCVQGTPTRVSENEFSYGYSTVRFRNERVESWNDISKVLKAR